MITELECAYLAEFGHGWVRDFALEMAALLTGEGGLFAKNAILLNRKEKTYG